VEIGSNVHYHFSFERSKVKVTPPLMKKKTYKEGERKHVNSGVI